VLRRFDTYSYRNVRFQLPGKKVCDKTNEGEAERELTRKNADADTTVEERRF
jgi:hypothetical protein